MIIVNTYSHKWVFSNHGHIDNMYTNKTLQKHCIFFLLNTETKASEENESLMMFKDM